MAEPVISEPLATGPLATKPVVTILIGQHPPGQLERLERLAEVRITDAEALADNLPGCDVLYLWDFFSEQLQEAWPVADQLKWVHIAAAGMDKLLFPALVESDILVTNAHGIFDTPMAEYVLGCVIRHAKQLDVTQRHQAEHRWQIRETGNVAGSSVLVVGVGGIGRETGRLLRAVGMNVEGLGRTARGGDDVFSDIHSSDDLVAVVGRFDYVVLACPLTADTVGMVSAEVIRAMKPGSYLVNVGRGRLVDQAALTDALIAGRLAGAALDTFEQEPLPPGDPLWDLDQVFVSPHTSSRTDGWLERLNEQFITNLQVWSQGGIPDGVVDKRLGFVARGV